jgi:hypothetical protein
MASWFRYYQLPMPLPDESSKPVFFFGLFEFLKLKIPRSSDVHLTSSVVIRGNPEVTTTAKGHRDPDKLYWISALIKSRKG